MAPRTRALLGYGAAIAVLLAVLGLYTQPQVMVALGDMVWACFN